jgi:hypothetical protein
MIGPFPRFYLRNPGIHNQDLSVFKNLPMGGEGKRYLQLRLEAFNIFNHPRWRHSRARHILRRIQRRERYADCAGSRQVLFLTRLWCVRHGCRSRWIPT